MVTKKFTCCVNILFSITCLYSRRTDRAWLFVSVEVREVCTLYFLYYFRCPVYLHRTCKTQFMTKAVFIERSNTVDRQGDYRDSLTRLRFNGRDNKVKAIFNRDINLRNWITFCCIIVLYKSLHWAYTLDFRSDVA